MEFLMFNSALSVPFRPEGKGSVPRLCLFPQTPAGPGSALGTVPAPGCSAMGSPLARRPWPRGVTEGTRPGKDTGAPCRPRLGPSWARLVPAGEGT